MQQMVQEKIPQNAYSFSAAISCAARYEFVYDQTDGFMFSSWFLVGEGQQGSPCPIDLAIRRSCWPGVVFLYFAHLLDNVSFAEHPKQRFVLAALMRYFLA